MRLGGDEKPASDKISKPLDVEPPAPAKKPMIAPTRLDLPAGNEVITIEGQNPGKEPKQPADETPDKPQPVPLAATLESDINLPDEVPSGPLPSEPQDSIDSLMDVGEMKARMESSEQLGSSSANPLPVAEAVDSSPELENLADLAKEAAGAEHSVEEHSASFEVLDDSDEDVIDLSDGDIVVGQNPENLTQGVDLDRFPDLPPSADAVQPIVAERVNPDRSVGQPVVPTGPSLSIPGQPTPTSMNPAFKAFGPPPPAHYPDEPPVPDGPSREASVGASVAGVGVARRPANQGGASVEAVIALIVGFLAVTFALWIAFQNFSAVSQFLPGSGFGSARFTGVAGIVAALSGLRLLAALVLLVAGCLFFVNEILRLNGSDPMPYSCIIALVAGCAMLLIEFAVSSYFVFHLNAARAYGLVTGGTVFLLLLSTFFRSIIPVALIVVSALRQR